MYVYVYIIDHLYIYLIGHLYIYLIYVIDYVLKHQINGHCR